MEKRLNQADRTCGLRRTNAFAQNTAVSHGWLPHAGNTVLAVHLFPACSCDSATARLGCLLVLGDADTKNHLKPTSGQKLPVSRKATCTLSVQQCSDPIDQLRDSWHEPNNLLFAAKRQRCSDFVNFVTLGRRSPPTTQTDRCLTLYRHSKSHRLQMDEEFRSPEHSGRLTAVSNTPRLAEPALNLHTHALQWSYGYVVRPHGTGRSTIREPSSLVHACRAAPLCTMLACAACTVLPWACDTPAHGVDPPPRGMCRPPCR